MQHARSAAVSDADVEALLPEGWPRPVGYANGVSARGRLVFVAGQVGWDTAGTFADGLVAQVRQALENIVAVLRAGGAEPRHLVRLTWYVVDKRGVPLGAGGDRPGVPRGDRAELPGHGAGAGGGPPRRSRAGGDRGHRRGAG